VQSEGFMQAFLGGPFNDLPRSDGGLSGECKLNLNVSGPNVSEERRI